MYMKIHICVCVYINIYVLINVSMAEWLRRWTWNPMGSARVGSNPAADVSKGSLFSFWFSFLFCFSQFKKFEFIKEKKKCSEKKQK